MKKIILSLLCWPESEYLNAHGYQTGKKTVPKPVSILKTTADSVSYVLGEVAAFQP